MDFVLRGPQIHSTFGNLGYGHADGYHINENCNETLETILHNILTEDKFLYSYRRSISFGQNIKKDLIPLLVHTNDDKTIELLIRILVNLTIPIECLMTADHIATDLGSYSVFEINILLAAAKTAFTDSRVMKAVIDFLKRNVDVEQQSKLTPEQCVNITNSLLLLRNILHIPEVNCSNIAIPDQNESMHLGQNQILWNIFSQNIDKILMRLMTIPEATNWAVTMVQLIALLYKDQHVVTLHKLLSLWLEASLSESSEDNESNTSRPDRERSEDSSSILTSNPTSDCSEMGGTEGPTAGNAAWPTNQQAEPPTDQVGAPPSVSAGATTEQAGAQTLEQAVSTKQAIMQPPAQTSAKPPDPVSASPPASERASAGQPEQKSAQISEQAQAQLPEQNSMRAPERPPRAARSLRVRPSSLPDEAPAAKQQKKNKDKTHKFTSVKKSVGSQQSKGGTKTTVEKMETIAKCSDGLYGKQIENEESTSKSSNEVELIFAKPMQQTPQSTKKRTNDKPRPSSVNVQEDRRRKIFKRRKATSINLQCLSNKTPTDDDISAVLKEFTIAFLLKGYNSLVLTLHKQILCNQEIEMDKSHFFWLVTYFLKFATQIELDLDLICSVLSYDILSFLTSEGVNLCEQFELAVKLDGNDLKPSLRRLHLDVTAIREFVQAIDKYRKIPYISGKNLAALSKLQQKMVETDELRLLLVLLLRHYNASYHTKQYLQDLVVTNHILLLFVNDVMKSPNYSGTTNILDHMQQFATPEIMYQYGLMLEDYESNVEFVNDCIFTMMHHVGGSLGSLHSLFQPRILKTFTSIWKSEFKICADWSDLIEYVINTFTKKPHTMEMQANLCQLVEGFEENQGASIAPPSLQPAASDTSSAQNRWTDDELVMLSYMQCQTSHDIIGEIVKLFQNDGIVKKRFTVIKELQKQGEISDREYERLVRFESEVAVKKTTVTRHVRDDEMEKLCEQLIQDGKSKFLDWVQKVLLDTCYAKIFLKKKSKVDHDILNFDVFKSNSHEAPVSPVSYHSLLLNQLVPLVPWNCEQAAICKDLKFLQLLHKLGFHMPVDTGKLFIRIPHLWTADMLYKVAGKITTIPKKIKINFTMNDLLECSLGDSTDPSLMNEVSNSLTSPENFYEMQKEKLLTTMDNSTPMPGTSFNSEMGENNCELTNWMDVEQKPQDNDPFPNMENLCESASVASDHEMYVSDEDDGTDIIAPRTLDVKTFFEKLKYSD